MMRVELFVGDVEVGRRRIDAGAIHERVDAAVLLDDACRAATCTDSRSAASTSTNVALPPSFSIAATRSLPRSALRPATTTVAPACAKPVAQLAAEHAGAADHDGDLAVEAEQFLQVVGHSACTDSPSRWRIAIL